MPRRAAVYEVGMHDVEEPVSDLDLPGGRPGRRRRRGVAILPALFTLGNCLSGFASISFSARGLDKPPGEFASYYAIAGYFIFLAMIFDMFDGFVARLTRSASDFGAELDSLADMVSFGIAPAFMSIHLIGSLLHTPDVKYYEFPGPFQENAWLRLFWVIAGIYVSCTALRLARFNVINKHEISSHMSFRGMPSPGAAAVVASTVIFFEGLRTGSHMLPFNVSPQMIDWLKALFPYLVPVVLLISALLMVSRFAYTHLINRFLRGRKKFRTLVAVFLLIMVIVVEPQLAVITAIYLYALSAPVMWLLALVTGKGRRPGGKAVMTEHQ
ncbi:MAG TPA: CDP-alcohol phosphatidyltransferase family protein [Phycisphaerae bacterium]|jgi:CDP-diacylglycerol--serine O-phosphatidyltransferase|nr:CDP-alcohol phosphatidyltransferase family protein [Phycisphaerae bacterium]